MNPDREDLKAHMRALIAAKRDQRNMAPYQISTKHASQLVVRIKEEQIVGIQKRKLLEDAGYCFITSQAKIS